MATFTCIGRHFLYCNDGKPSPIGFFVTIIIILLIIIFISWYTKCCTLYESNTNKIENLKINYEIYIGVNDINIEDISPDYNSEKNIITYNEVIEKFFSSYKLGNRKKNIFKENIEYITSEKFSMKNNDIIKMV